MKNLMIAGAAIAFAGTASAGCYNFADAGEPLPVLEVCFIDIQGNETCKEETVVAECQDVNAWVVEFQSGMSITRELPPAPRHLVTFADADHRWQLDEEHFASCQTAGNDAGICGVFEGLGYAN